MLCIRNSQILRIFCLFLTFVYWKGQHWKILIINSDYLHFFDLFSFFHYLLLSLLPLSLTIYIYSLVMWRHLTWSLPKAFSSKLLIINDFKSFSFLVYVLREVTLLLVISHVFTLTFCLSSELFIYNLYFFYLLPYYSLITLLIHILVGHL